MCEHCKKLKKAYRERIVRGDESCNPEYTRHVQRYIDWLLQKAATAEDSFGQRLIDRAVARGVEAVAEAGRLAEEKAARLAAHSIDLETLPRAIQVPDPRWHVVYSKSHARTHARTHLARTTFARAHTHHPQLAQRVVSRRR
jgi:hypothetical protein